MSEQLQFNIRGQTISRADRFYVVQKSQNYLRAKFSFLTDDWSDLAKIAVFTRDGNSYKMILDEEGACMVPWEHLEDTGTIEVSIYGAGGTEETPVLETVNTAKIYVGETGYVDGAINEAEPTPEVWEQILSRLINIDGGTFEDWKEGDG